MNELLWFFASLQVLIGVLMFRLPHMLGWQTLIAGLPTLFREVYHVHALFVSVALWIFAGMTFLYGTEIGTLGIGIGLFWAVRVGVQLFYYSPSHWRGIKRETRIHIALLVIYSAMSATYLAASL